MKAHRLVECAIHFPRRATRECAALVYLIACFIINRFARYRVTQPNAPVVSLTTHEKRINKVYYAIESIALGEVLPSRLILWIDDEALLNDLPPSIRRLQERGLEVKSCKNYGPHTKYYPFVDSERGFADPLVTADDDILYPRYWLKNLAKANLEAPDMICCYWAVVVSFDDVQSGPLPRFPPCLSTDGSFLHMAQGVMGVIYPQQFLRMLQGSGTAFESCCPKQDDYWLHVQALRAGYRVRQIVRTLPYYSFQSIPRTQDSGLCKENVDKNQREWQFRATYTPADIQRLKECSNHPKC